MCQKESWGAIFATTEAHSTQRDQPPRMHGTGLWMHEQKEQRVNTVQMIGLNCILWCPGWDGDARGGMDDMLILTIVSFPLLIFSTFVFLMLIFIPYSFDVLSNLSIIVCRPFLLFATIAL